MRSAIRRTPERGAPLHRPRTWLARPSALRPAIGGADPPATGLPNAARPAIDHAPGSPGRWWSDEKRVKAEARRAGGVERQREVYGRAAAGAAAGTAVCRHGCAD